MFGDQAPATLRELRTSGQRTPEELIDRYGLICRPIRDLLVDYLRERQPALDYSSLVSLSNLLGNRFWADLERHHPGIDSLHLPAEVANAWKQRLRTVTRTRRTREGRTAETTVARMNYREALTPVRASARCCCRNRRARFSYRMIVASARPRSVTSHPR
ncbi:MAG: hypothetical protein GEV28_38390 [Actinophytocola sp.]|uniref:hypothetical protein n=1 Tax=Actinophytocola sp. TaxID=1872138 RepID=UPI00132BE376|nr:hypothetical protein [Actinophytocola sp.]MPZ85932.1 hypothetical protein [Actinophytocola sp.]